MEKSNVVRVDKNTFVVFNVGWLTYEVYFYSAFKSCRPSLFSTAQW
jgi:hypothetical protein